MTTHYTAFVIARFRNADGDIESRVFEDDVTDEVNAGADREELADRIYWNSIHGAAGFFDVTAGGVREEQAA